MYKFDPNETDEDQEKIREKLNILCEGLRYMDTEFMPSNPWGKLCYSMLLLCSNIMDNPHYNRDVLQPLSWIYLDLSTRPPSFQDSMSEQERKNFKTGLKVIRTFLKSRIYKKFGHESLLEIQERLKV